MNRGVIYCAIGQKYLDEAIYSASSLKKFNPYLSITIFVSLNQKITSNIFFNIIYCPIAYHPWKQKVWCMLNTPYLETLYLDSDTEILGDLESAFSDLFDSDILIACVRNWVNGKLISFEKPSKCGNYKRLNTGVIYYRSNLIVLDFLNKWFTATGGKTGNPTLGIDCDQSIFNDLYLEARGSMVLKIIKNIEFNCRLIFIPHLNKKERASIKIIHQHHLNYAGLLRLYLNRVIVYRYLKEWVRARILKIKMT